MDLKELIKQYQALEDAAAKATDKSHAAGFTKQRDAVFAQIQAMQGNPEVGDVLAPGEAPADNGPRPNPMGFIEGAPTTIGVPPPEVGTPITSKLGMAFKELAASKARTAQTNATAQQRVSFDPNTTQPTGEAPIGAGNTTVPAQAPGDSGLGLVDRMQLAQTPAGGGGGGGGGRVAAAMANANQAGADADAAIAAQKQAVLDRGEHSYDQGVVEGEAVASMLTSLRKAEDEYQVRAEHFRQYARSKLEESEAAARDFRAAASEGTFAQSMGTTGGRLLAGLSVALGAVSAGLTQSGVNPGMEVLKFRVEADLKDRQERLRGKAAALDNLDRLLQRNQELFADETSARNATRAALFDQLKAEVQRISAVGGGQDALLAAKQVNASLDAELARSKEALANQALLAATKAAGRGKRTMLDVYNEALKNQQLELNNRKTAAEVGALENPSSGAALGTVEGQRASERKRKLVEGVQPYNDVLEAGKRVLTLGVPSVITRAQDSTAGTLASGGLSKVALSDREQEQLAAIANFTKQMVRAVEGARPSDRDWEVAKEFQLRQGVTTSQEALVKQVQAIMGIADANKRRYLQTDPEAASAVGESALGVGAYDAYIPKAAARHGN